MFVYLLIAAELALLYVVFWYLYVREPKYKTHVKGSLWGAYQESPEQYADVDPYLTWLEAQQQPDADGANSAHAEEFVWNHGLNRYVPASQQEAMSFLSRMATRLDRQFSQLNVKP